MLFYDSVRFSLLDVPARVVHRTRVRITRTSKHKRNVTHRAEYGTPLMAYDETFNRQPFGFFSRANRTTAE